MSKIPCNTIRDLLPLYIDDICSEESKKLIEDHLTICENCRDYYEDMTGELPQILPPEELDSVDELFIFLKKIGKNTEKLARRLARKMTIKYSILIAIALFIILSIYYVYSGYARTPIGPNQISVKEIYQLEDGNLYMVLESEVPIVDVSFQEYMQVLSPDNHVLQLKMSIACQTEFWRFWDDSLPKEAAIVIPNQDAPSTTDYSNNIRYDSCMLYYHFGSKHRDPLWEYDADATYTVAPSSIENAVKDYLENPGEHSEDCSLTFAPKLVEEY